MGETVCADSKKLKLNASLLAEGGRRGARQKRVRKAEIPKASLFRRFDYMRLIGPI